MVRTGHNFLLLVAKDKCSKVWWIWMDTLVKVVWRALWNKRDVFWFLMHWPQFWKLTGFHELLRKMTCSSGSDFWTPGCYLQNCWSQSYRKWWPEEVKKTKKTMAFPWGFWRFANANGLQLLFRCWVSTFQKLQRFTQFQRAFDGTKKRWRNL